VSEDAVDPSPLLATADHVDNDGGAIDQTEQSRGAAVGHDRPLATGQDRRPHPPSLPDGGMADRVDAAEDPMQVTGSDQVLDSASADPKSGHLSPRGHPLLAFRQSRQLDRLCVVTFACHASKSHRAKASLPPGTCMNAQLWEDAGA
jgi:hypothetical protein